MSKHEIIVNLSEDVLKDIENIVLYKKVKDLIFSEEYASRSVEDFIVGCVCHYLRSIKHQIDISGIEDLGKPYRLKNNFKEYMDKRGIIPADLAKETGIGASNISLILKNKNQPSLDYFLRIWMALKCPPLDKILYREVEE